MMEGANDAILGDQQVDRIAASVAVKLPDFWKNDPDMWFAQAEAQFALANVTKDETRFYHIVAKIDQTVICHIADLVANPPAADKYKAVKERLISRFALSWQAKLERLLGSHDLGDLRPTHLLAKMQELSAGLAVDENLLKMFFLQRLPTHIRGILSISDGTITKLAEMADKMTDYSPANIASVNQPVDTIDELKTQIAALTAEIKRMKVQPPRQRSRSVSRSSSRASSGGVCWYHRQYGSNAHQCREPCTFSPKN